LVKRKVGEVEAPSILVRAKLHEREAQKILRRIPPRGPMKIQTVLDAMLLSSLNLRFSFRKREILENS
jgi:hypothetical protein